ncbi:MAG: TetR/AcrR family transcriptional regulator [Thermodesulfobacteriota bacterium]
MGQAPINRRDCIVEATIRLIAEYGFHGTSVAMIAAAAGVGTGTIYRYFRDKDALVVEIFRQVDAVFKRTLLQDYDERRSVRERFFHLCRGVFRYGIAKPFEFKFIEQYLYSPYGTDLRREKLFCARGENGDELPFSQVFESGKRQRLIKDLPQFALIALAIGPVIFLVKDCISGLVRAEDATIDAVLSACWDAVKR